MTREHRYEIEIDATSDEVWEAVSDADGITGWFADAARVTPGEGGSVTVGWAGADGEMMEGTSRIDVWEPGRRLRLVEEPMEGMPAGAEPFVQEWTIEARGGRTVLRFTHSGFPDGDDWSEMYDSTAQGWELFLATLQYVLPRHPHRPRHKVVATGALGDGPAAWPALARALGLADGKFRAELPGGATLSGTVLLERPGAALLAVVEELDDGLLFLTLETTAIWASLSAFGDARSRLDAVGRDWRDWLLSTAGGTSAG